MSDTFQKKKGNQAPFIQWIILLSTYYLPSSGLGAEDSKVKDVVSIPERFHLLCTYSCLVKSAQVTSVAIRHHEVPPCKAN